MRVLPRTPFIHFDRASSVEAIAENVLRIGWSHAMQIALETTGSNPPKQAWNVGARASAIQTQLCEKISSPVANDAPPFRATNLPKRKETT